MNKTIKNSGFTLVEVMVVLAILGIISAIAISSMINLSDKTKITVDNANLRALNSATLLYEISEVENLDADTFIDFNSDASRMQELVETNYLKYIVVALQDDFNFIWSIDTQLWTLSSEAIAALTPLGSDFGEISFGMISIIQEKYETDGTYGRTWGSYRYTDLGLDPSDWEDPIDHIQYTPSGSKVLIEPEEGYTFVFENSSGETVELPASYNYNLIYYDDDGNWYYHSIDDDNQIDISTLSVIESN